MAQTHMKTLDKCVQPKNEVQHVSETKDPNGSTQLAKQVLEDEVSQESEIAGSEVAAEMTAAVKAGHSMARLQQEQGDIATRPEYLEAHKHHMQTPEAGPDFALM
eukprot:5654360-Amphidinium_carterae.1